MWPPDSNRPRPENEILLGETTYDLVRRHVEVEVVEPLELKGKSERVAAYRVVRLRDVDARRASRKPRSSAAPTEWAELERSYRLAVDGPSVAS